jgi:thioesterase domain-containing protein
MATDYVAEIRRIQPHGPYFLAGHSFGGLVSFEIAQQLVRDGERVNFLALIDTALRDASIEPWSPALGAARVSHRIYSIFLKLQWIRNALLMRQRDLWIRLGCPIPYEHRPAFYERLCVRAGRVYVPKPYIGHVTMFSSAGNSEWHRARWGALAGGGLTVLEVPAGHNDMVLPPYSQLLAEQFDACLDGH